MKTTQTLLLLSKKSVTQKTPQWVYQQQSQRNRRSLFTATNSRPTVDSFGSSSSSSSSENVGPALFVGSGLMIGALSGLMMFCKHHYDRRSLIESQQATILDDVANIDDNSDSVDEQFNYYVDPVPPPLFGKKVSAAGVSGLQASLRAGEWNEYPLLESHPINHNTTRFRFGLESDNRILGLPVSSCIVIKADTPSRQQLFRLYTPTSTDNERGYFDLVVKKYETGGVSEYIHSLKHGDSIEVSGPILKFPYEANNWHTISMIAGGTGITPMLQLLKAIAYNEKDHTKAHVIFANKSVQDIILREELDKLARDFPNQIKVFYTVDELDTDEHPNWKGGVGYVDAAMIRQQLPPPDSENHLVLVCGPDQMLSAVAGEKGMQSTQGDVGGALKACGFQTKSVFKF